MEISRLTRDGNAEPVSRDQILRRERGQGNFLFPVQLTTSRIGNLTRLIHTLAICDDYTCILTYITTKYPRRFEVQHCPSSGLSDGLYCSVFYLILAIFPQNALLIMYTPLTTFFKHAPIDTLGLLFEQHPPVVRVRKLLVSQVRYSLPIRCTDGTLPPWFWLVY